MSDRNNTTVDLSSIDPAALERFATLIRAADLFAKSGLSSLQLAEYFRSGSGAPEERGAAYAAALECFEQAAETMGQAYISEESKAAYEESGVDHTAAISASVREKFGYGCIALFDGLSERFPEATEEDIERGVIVCLQEVTRLLIDGKRRALAYLDGPIPTHKGGAN